MSAIVIGAATTASFAGTCVISAQWGYSPNTQRLYCIGEWLPDPSRTFHKPTETLSLTIYAPGPSYSIGPSTSCVDATPQVDASISPAACGETFTGVSGPWQISGYSYSKDDGGMPGQETWNLTKWKNLNTAAPSVGDTTYPTFILRGISEGQGTLNSGLVFSTETRVQSQSGNVSANGFGKADTIYSGVITGIGGGSSASGDTGQGSANIPLTPMYI